MEITDKIRSELGLAICLRDMGNGTSRIFMDDVKSTSIQNPTSWQYDCFYTYTPEFENSKIDEMGISDEDFQKIGEVIVARLLALNGRVR